ncbi:MAG: hypothetical protein KA715_05680 [Xanthomonadaceae bacterium]|nr:hypothetical protein [Xanthomonadaceae bacterium]
MKNVWIALLSVFFHSTVAFSAVEKLSIELEVERAGTKPSAAHEISVEPHPEWMSYETGTKTVLLTRTPETAGRIQSLELLILDKDQPGKILASPIIQMNDSAQTRARLRLENGDSISVRINRKN